MVQIIDLGNKALLEVLVFFARNPTTKISYTDLRKKTKIAKATLTKHLNFLLKEDFIRVEKIGLSKLYQLNKENCSVKQIKILNNLLSLKGIKQLEKKYNIEIFLYGSAARGEDTENSDIDLLVIGKTRKEQIFPDINKISKDVGREIKIVIFSPLEWSQLARKDAPFYERVEKDKIRMC